MSNEYPEVWAVWGPGEDLPQLHVSRADAIDHADTLARMHIGQTIHVFKLTSVGTISYPNTPTKTGEAN
jgi:hypothetical protein